jgi:hypothetical protein
MDRSPPQHVEDNTLLCNILHENVELDEFVIRDFEEPEDPHAQDVEAQRRAKELRKDPHYVPSNEVIVACDQ